MKPLFTGATCSAAVLAASMAVFAQATQNPSPPPPASGAPAAQEPAPAAAAQPEMTIVGCVQSEADYRRAKSAGAGGAAGTGVGTGNEFVLVAAPASTGATASAERPATPEAVGTSGTTGEAYELTGAAEGELAQHVGKKVEIVGKLKKADDLGAAAAARPAPGSQELNLKEFEVISVRESTGSCPPSQK
jgi:hypothetical protein